MLVFPQIDPMNSHGFLLGRFDPRGPPAFKMETKTTKTSGGRNSNLGHVRSKDLQEAPPSVTSTV